MNHPITRFAHPPGYSYEVIASPSTASPPSVSRSEFPREQVARQPERTDQRGLFDSRIVIVDDEPLVTSVIQKFLATEGYTNLCAINDSTVALDRMIDERPDAILLDIMMPRVSGLDILMRRQSDSTLQHVPVIILSASSETEIKREALKLGATEFLAKPVDTIDLVLRVRNALLVKRHQDHLHNYAVELEQEVRRRTRQIDQSREQIVHCLAKAAEFRDNETGQHVVRVGKYASVIAHHLGFGPNYCRQIELAAQLHDVGKIGIPDSILLNPGRLSGEQFNVMKEHCSLGVEIMRPFVADQDSKGDVHFSARDRGSAASPTLLELAASIARSHHEKWDGTGYPAGLRGEAIPVEGRITCVADVFDALCSVRPYKAGYPLQQCIEIMTAERGTRFDPQILDLFLANLDEIQSIRNRHPDQ
ncbi:MAG: response regulator [Mariniblastus sp.]|nr:response regulator [Mariniblastus sp.]